MRTHKKHSKLSAQQLKTKWASLMSLAFLGAILTGMVGGATLSKTSHKTCGFVMSATSFLLLSLGAVANAQRQFYANKLKNRHFSYRSSKNR